MSAAVSTQVRCLVSGFLKLQVMKVSNGKANPALAGEILERKLKA